MKRSGKLTIKRKLTLSFALLLIIPSLTVEILSYNTAKNHTEDQLISEATENVELLQELIKNDIEPRLHMLIYCRKLSLQKIVRKPEIHLVNT